MVPLLLALKQLRDSSNLPASRNRDDRWKRGDSRKRVEASNPPRR